MIFFGSFFFFPRHFHLARQASSLSCAIHSCPWKINLQLFFLLSLALSSLTFPEGEIFHLISRNTGLLLLFKLYIRAYCKNIPFSIALVLSECIAILFSNFTFPRGSREKEYYSYIARTRVPIQGNTRVYICRSLNTNFMLIRRARYAATNIFFKSRE